MLNHILLGMILDIQTSFFPSLLDYYISSPMVSSSHGKNEQDVDSLCEGPFLFQSGDASQTATIGRVGTKLNHTLSLAIGQIPIQPFSPQVYTAHKKGIQFQGLEITPMGKERKPFSENFYMGAYFHARRLNPNTSLA